MCFGEATFWGGTEQSIIGYGDLTYERPGKETVEWFVVGLAPQKNYNSIYVNARDEDGYLIQRFADRLGKVKVRSAAITFKKADDIDLDGARGSGDSGQGPDDLDRAAPKAPSPGAP